jgi:type VI secretion system protein ImpL
MKGLLAVLKKRWLLGLLGVLALAFLVWVVGPLVAVGGHVPLASEWVRALVILLLFALWGASLLRAYLKAKRANRQLMSGIADASQVAEPEAGPQQTEEEVAALRQRFEEALEFLKKSGDRGARNLYELPWYIIIGPPGCGKTTALVNSGLDFPLEERFGKGALRGVGGTRNCDWWFTNDAILLDTAGRYTTQDSDPLVDSAGWLGFLSLLKRYRRRRPINGVLVAMSLSDLMLLGEREREAHALAVKRRIQELRRSLGIRFPVYVLLTKADLVAGFVEFFDDLRREERAQVWGVTFPLDQKQQGVVQHFGAELAALLRRLNDRLLSRLGQERDLQRRRAIFGLPAQIASLEGAIQGFLDAVFRPSRFEETPLLRGVYITSGTQEGTPIDRVMGALARTFGVSQQAMAAFGGQGRSYFLTSLLRDVVFQEAALAGVERRFERQRAWMQRGAYAGAITATVLAALAWSASFTRNQLDVRLLDERVEAYRAVAAPLAGGEPLEAVLPRLDALVGVGEVYGWPERDVPWLSGLGLYQGDKLGRGAREGYRRELNRLFLPKVAEALAGDLARGRGDLDFQYEALKAYLMLGDPERLDPPFVKAWLTLDWRTRYPDDAALRGRLERHLDAALAAGVDGVSLDRGLVAEVRRRLTQVPVAKLVYGRLKRDYQATGRPGLRVADLTGPFGRDAFVRASGASLDDEIPGLFTHKDYFQWFLPESKDLAGRIRDESWVLGGDDQGELSHAEIEQLDEELRRLYYEEYVRTWDAVVEDLRIVPFTSPGHALKVVEVLSGETSPIRSVLQGLDRNTSLTRLPGAAQEVAEKAAQTLQQESRLARLMGQAEEKGAVPAVELPGAVVQRHFERLTVLVRSRGEAPAPIERLIGLIADLLGYLGSIAGGPAEGALRAASGAGGDEAVGRLLVEAARQPEPVKTWLTQLAERSRTATVSSARSQLDGKLKGGVVPACRKATQNRYPFFPGARQEVPLQDFGKLFGAGGLLDQFFQENLAPFVDTSRMPWTARRVPGGLSVSGGALREFQRAAVIRDTFFQAGGQMPKVRFALKPISLDAEVSQFTLDIDGQKFVYRHGPAQVENGEWPGPQGSKEVRVAFRMRDGSEPGLVEDGAWALFRVLDRSSVRATASETLQVTFEAAGRRATWELRASSVSNPFALEELRRFRCPEGL